MYSYVNIYPGKRSRGHAIKRVGMTIKISLKLICEVHKCSRDHIKDPSPYLIEVQVQHYGIPYLHVCVKSRAFNRNVDKIRFL